MDSMQNNTDTFHPEIYVVAVCRNEERYIENFILSLIRSTYPVHIVIVDNASSDNTAAITEKYLTDIVLLRQNENTGFGVANNIGIQYALNHGADYLFLLNVDMTIAPDTVFKLMNTAGAHPEYGIISPVCLNFSKDRLESMFYESLTVKDALKKDVRLYISELYMKKTHTQDIYDISFINAAHWFMSAAVLKQTGGFDPVFFPIYNEDDELCVRVLKHGFRIGFIPDAVVYHDTEDRGSSKLPPVHPILIRDYAKILHHSSFLIYYRFMILSVLRLIKNILLFRRENFQFNMHYFRELLRRRAYLKNGWLRNQRNESIGFCISVPDVCKPDYL